MVSADSAHIKPKVCKTCGNPNHPLAAQCRYCGGRLRVRMDWFCTVCIVLIAVTLLALAGYIIPENAFGWDYDAISASLCSCYANKKEAQKSEARNEP